MTPYQLKRSILTAAIQGRITNQDEAEGTGTELLVTTAIEKKRRLAVENVKAGKPCKPVTEEDALFDIPSNWSWARFGDLVLNFDSRRRPVTKEDRKTTKGLYDYFGATGAIDKVDEYIFDGEFLMIGEDGGNFFVDRDNSFIANGQFWANNHVHVVQPVTCEIWYLKHCLDAYNMPNMGLINGIAVPKLNQENLNSIMIPVPPLAEQKRIVAKIEELLPLIDRYEQAWSKLEDFNKRFPVDMQKSILQVAIQGKLVPQLPEEGTGEELFLQIQAEKQRLIKEGVIKKEKPLPEITEDEIPFDIPDSWKWVHLQSLCSLIGDIDHNMPKSVDPKEGVLFLSAKDLLDDGTINYTDNVKYISQNDFERLSRKALPRRNDIIYSRIGAALGKARVVESDVTFLVSYSCCVIRPLFVDVKFLRYYLESPLILAHSVKARQSIGVPDLGMGEIKKYLVALPPLAEQKRIVAKLEEILPLCESLK